MSITVPTTEPATIRAGDTVTWTRSYTDWPASEYTLSYRLVNATDTIDITATADGDDHLVEIATGTTEHYVAGEYQWFAFMSTLTERYTIDQGVMTVLPDAATATDFRTHAKKVLDIIEAAIEGNTTPDVLEYAIGGRTLRRMSAEERIRWRNYYRSEYYAEQAKNSAATGRPTNSKIGVRFKKA